MRPRPLNPRTYIWGVVVFFLFGLFVTLAPLYVHIKLQIRSHSQPVIKISNSKGGTIVEDKEVTYYHKR